MAGGVAEVPSTTSRKLRACLRCQLIKTDSQFRSNGCENCPELELNVSTERIEHYTTPTFQGMISMMSPTDSWVARWQRQDRKVRGVYAIQVTGTMPDDDQVDIDE